MGSLWHWIVRSWASLGIGSLFGAGVVKAFETFKWFYPSRADFRTERQKKKEELLDVRVLAALSDPNMERQSRGMSGAGFPLSRVSDIATHLQENRDDVFSSLSRLEQRKRVTSSRDKYWFPLPD
jgi:hypothetical protein